MKKKIVSLVCILTIVFTMVSFINVSAVDYGCPVKPSSESIYLVNMDTNTVVYEKNSDVKKYPASTTKIMTYIIVSEAVDDIDNTKVTIKKSVLDLLLGTGSSMSGLEYRIDKEMTVKDLLYCLMVPSGNDASLILADYIGKGNIDTFVSMMNQKAKELGCKNTNFVNPHGLHDDNHYSTAQDLHLITSYALTLPNFSEITNTATYYCEGDTYPIVTTNFMIDPGRGGDYYYLYARGIKTGTTTEAGRCLISTAIADGYAYMCVALDSPYEENEKNGAMIDSKELFRWALVDLELNAIVSKETPVCEQKINYAWETESLLLVPEDDVSAIVPKDFKESDITIDYNILESIDAPIKQGENIGTAKIFYKGQEIKNINLVASKSIDRSPLLYVTAVVKSIITSFWFLLAAAIVIILLVIYLIIVNRYGNKKKQRKNVRRYRNL